ncbi:MAG: O-antigen ligase family protein [Candidatus Berkelbacteria bacterium]|nr:O-antigen ligase family protein [Candidatus Berkelbacteria bacterium]
MVFYIIIALVAIGFLVLALKKPFLALLIFLFLLPLNAFLTTYIVHLFNLESTQRLILTLWKEWIVLALLIWAMGHLIKEKLAKQSSLKLFWFDYLIFGLFVLALLTIIWGSKNPKVIIFGLRYDFEFFALYFIGRIMRPEPKKLKIALLTVLASSLIVALFAILQVTILPWDFLNRFGYTYALEWVPGADLQSSQIVGSTRDLSRILSTLSGPNQLGSYLALISCSLLCIILFVRKNIYKLGAGVYFLLILLPLYRTYSRSAWLGLAVAVLALMIYLLVRLFSKKKEAPKSNFYITMMAIVFLVVIAILGYVYFNSVNSGLLKEMINRGFSTSGHIEAMKRGVELIKDHPFGLGIGSAGPASQWSMGLTNEIITESNFLQFGVEMGILGMLGFIVIIITLIVKAFRQIAQKEDIATKILLLGSALGLIALSVNSLFLHSFADTVTSFTLFALLGIAINNRKNIDVIQRV